MINPFSLDFFITVYAGKVKNEQRETKHDQTL